MQKFLLPHKHIVHDHKFLFSIDDPLSALYMLLSSISNIFLPFCTDALSLCSNL